MSAPVVLVAEDEEDGREIFGTILRHNGFEVILAEDGAEAVRLATEHRPDLILMDLSLPELDGWEATALLKEDSRTAGIPVIALTVHVQQEDRRRAAEAGCVDFLGKPVEPRTVLALVKKYVGSERPAEARSVQQD